ncbi:Ff.00g036060.m01.CDS01 [Fusarium sp. VM40]|nr:Ff.00g036060.m01.CDS01 [Fusarium sp. VM40]
MQSKIALIGLALANYAIVGPCKPNRLTTSSILSVPTASIPTTAVTDISTDISSPTLAQSTTTQESQPIITNAIAGGSFAAADPNNPPSGLTGFSASGDAVFHEGGCYKEDGSRDNGCAALKATGHPGEKRDLGSFASIFQTLNSLSTGSRNKYTVQFFYIVASGGNQACTVSASLGNKQFYSNSLSSTGSGISWNRVLQQVDSDSSSAAFSISMSCSGSGTSMIFVDSVFISNQVTPENIGDFKLDFGTLDPDPVSTSLVGPVVSTTEVPTLATSDADVTSAEVSSPVSTPVDNTNLESSAHVSSSSAEDNNAGTSAPITATSPINTAIESTTAEGDSHSTMAEEASSTSSVTSQEDPEQSTSAAAEHSQPGTELPGSLTADSTTLPDPIATTSETPKTESQTIDSTSTIVSLSATHTAPVDVASTLSTTPQPTEPACKTTCEKRNDAWDHDEWNCEVYGLYSGPTYGVPGDDDDETRHYFQNPEECAAICKTTPGCKSSGIMFAAAKCFFSNNVVTRSEVRDMMDDSIDVNWSGMQCFRCSECDLSPSSTRADIQTTTKAPVIKPTTLATTTSPPPETTTQPTEVCLYNRGQTCEFDRFKDHSDTLCIYAAYFTGQTWKESREKYPFQDTLQQCAAICQTLEGCESSGYYSTENRCLFTSKKLQRSDMVSHDDRPFDHTVWSHNSCFACPDCVASSDPVTPGWMCSYEQGDVCQRIVPRKTDALCKYEGMFEPYIEESHDRYPDQSSPEKCAAICLTQDYCTASGYKDGGCLFAFTELKAEKFRLDWPDHSRDAVWDDRSCFECPGCTE